MRALKRLAISLGLVLGVTLLAAGLLALRPASTAPLEGPAAIATLESVPLGGVEQTILIRGKDRTAPVLLYLHGGPGFPHLSLAPRYSDELEKEFVVVHWDQRGAGASCAGTDWDNVTLEQIVADTIELSAQLAERFGSTGRIVLLGHSWGSVVGALAVQKRPDLYHAYVGLGQLVNGRQNEVLSLEWTVGEAQRRNDQEALAALRTVAPPYSDYEQLGKQRKWLIAYGGSVYAMDRVRPLIWPALFGPEYTLGTRFSFPGCFSASINAMWGRIDGVDFPSQIPRLEVPVFFFIGRHDWNTPYALVEEWAEILEAPSVEVVWFEDAGHMIPVESPAEFQRALIEKVLPRAR